MDKAKYERRKRKHSAYKALRARYTNPKLGKGLCRQLVQTVR